MEQRDYLMRQIEQLGQVLARMLARLLNIQQAGQGSLNIDEIKRIYGDGIDLSLDLILDAPKEELVGILTSRINFIGHHLEKMAEIITETAGLYENSGQPETARELLEKSICIYEHLQDTSGNFSIDRMTKISQLRIRLPSV
jgi:hypothetical protein